MKLSSSVKYRMNEYAISGNLENDAVGLTMDLTKPFDMHQFQFRYHVSPLGSIDQRRTPLFQFLQERIGARGGIMFSYV